MTEKGGIQQIIEQVVSQALERHIPPLKDEVVRRVLQEVPAAVGSSASPDSLLKAVSAIHTVTAQRDVLRILLDNALHYCGRNALFIVKSGQATGWQGRAFANNEGIKDFPLDTNSPLVARALEGHIAVSSATSQMDPHFIQEFKAPKDKPSMLVPLMLRDKVAALVYADAGLDGGYLDAAALELLVLATGLWLEVTTLRKSAPKEGGAEPNVGEAPLARAAAAHAGPASSDPFATHVPAFAQSRSAAAESEPRQAIAEEAPVQEALPDSFVGLSPEDAKIHRKAQRFARLLVDEIKLYNKAKMNEGRKNRDLYDRLKEDIDKSRASYQKRYGNTVAASGDYFNQEIIRSLAEDDVSLLGSNFKR